MKLWTYAEVKQKVQADLDLQEETFITPDEMVGYCNEAIHEAESEILKLNEDYFLASAPLTLVQGTALYALPAGIYGQKIRGLQYTLGSLTYPVRRIRGANKFDEIAMINNFGPNEDYRYLILNSTAGAQSQIQLCPPSREAGAPITIWHIRSAQIVQTAAQAGILPTAPNTAGQLATILDIPEFTFFIIDFMKARCLAKDADPRLEMQMQALINQRKMMVDTLTQQIPDDDDLIVPDMSFYTTSS